MWPANVGCAPRLPSGCLKDVCQARTSQTAVLGLARARVAPRSLHAQPAFQIRLPNEHRR